MPLREHRGVLVVIVGAIALVVYPLAYRISSQQAGADASPPTGLASQPPPTGSIVATPGPTVLPPVESFWTANATRYRGANGARFVYECSPNGTPAVVWGTDTYTDDSSVCTAAVHRGVITFEDGGAVTIVIRPGLDAYVGSTRNGVTTEPYGAWEGSFRVVAP